MPRPVKCRKVCHFPNVLEFLPADNAEKKVPIVLTVDEYETIRLLDKKGYSQEQCAASMQIARTTVQRIYEIARKKIADALIDGHPLRIEGGDFRICDGQSSDCNLGGCYKQELYQKYAVEKGEGIMRIAVTYENGQIFQHFGHTETFKIYDVEEGKVVHSEVVDTNGSGHGALAGVLNALNADVLICGESRAKHRVTGYISEAAFFVELLQSCFYRGNITNDAVFGQYGQHFAKSVQRVLYCHGIYDQFGLKFLNLLQCGETIRVIEIGRAHV